MIIFCTSIDLYNWILYSFRIPEKVEVSNLDNLGVSYDLWGPGEHGLVLKSPGSCGVERDLGWKHFTLLYSTLEHNL